MERPTHLCKSRAEWCRVKAIWVKCWMEDLLERNQMEEHLIILRKKQIRRHKRVELGSRIRVASKHSNCLRMDLLSKKNNHRATYRAGLRGMIEWQSSGHIQEPDRPTKLKHRKRTKNKLWSISKIKRVIMWKTTKWTKSYSLGVNLPSNKSIQTNTIDGKRISIGHRRHRGRRRKSTASINRCWMSCHSFNWRSLRRVMSVREQPVRTRHHTRAKNPEPKMLAPLESVEPGRWLEPQLQACLQSKMDRMAWTRHRKARKKIKNKILMNITVRISVQMKALLSINSRIQEGLNNLSGVMAIIQEIVARLRRVPPSRMAATGHPRICSKYWGRRGRLTLLLQGPGQHWLSGIKACASRTMRTLEIRKIHREKIKTFRTSSSSRSSWASRWAANSMTSKASSAPFTTSPESLFTAPLGGRVQSSASWQAMREQMGFQILPSATTRLRPCHHHIK